MNWWQCFTNSTTFHFSSWQGPTNDRGIDPSEEGIGPQPVNPSGPHTTTYLLNHKLCVTGLLTIQSVISAYLASGKTGFGRGAFVIHVPERSSAQLHGSHPALQQQQHFRLVRQHPGLTGPQPKASDFRKELIRKHPFAHTSKIS